MKMKETFQYPSGVEPVFALIADEKFRVKAAEATGGLDVSATVADEGRATVVTLSRTQPADVPDFIKKFVGETVTVKQVEKWRPPAADGSRTADLRMKVAGQPAEFNGTATLKPRGDGADFTVQGDVKVSVPFVGKKIEPLIAKAIAASIRHDVHAGVKQLGS